MILSLDGLNITCWARARGGWGVHVLIQIFGGVCCFQGLYDLNFIGEHSLKGLVDISQGSKSRLFQGVGAGRVLQGAK